MKGIKTDFVNNKIILTKAAYRRSKDLGSDEAKEIKKILTALPQMEVVVRQSSSRHSSRIKYEKMIKYISCQDNSAALLDEFIRVRNVSQSLKNPYKYVESWFIGKFPDYNVLPDFTSTNEMVHSVA